MIFGSYLVWIWYWRGKYTSKRILSVINAFPTIQNYTSDIKTVYLAHIRAKLLSFQYSPEELDNSRRAANFDFLPQPTIVAIIFETA